MQNEDAILSTQIVTQSHKVFWTEKPKVKYHMLKKKQNYILYYMASFYAYRAVKKNYKTHPILKSISYNSFSNFRNTYLTL